MLTTGSAWATVNSVVINRSLPFADVSGYTYVDATLNGTAPGGPYSVGMVLIYPNDEGNGVGFVDWPNSVYYHRYGLNPNENLVFQFLRLTTEKYLFQRGYTYASVQWDKTVTDLFGPNIPADLTGHNRLVYGSISAGSDAWEILRDAAAFLRNPSTFQGPNGPRAVRTVLSAGYSQTAALEFEFLASGQNNGAYDGFMPQMIGLLCWERNNTAPLYGDLILCPSFPSDGKSKVMVIASESDFQVLNAYNSRNNGGDPNYIQYELTGVSHIPKAVADVSGFGATQQNSADPRPFFRGAVHNLTRWVRKGRTPPPSILAQGSIDSSGNFTFARDADGNALGGNRLPHMTQTADGQPAGAPLGTYNGIDFTAFNPFNIFVLLGGTFTPFSAADLAARYPGDQQKDLTLRAADELIEQGYLLGSDRHIYGGHDTDDD